MNITELPLSDLLSGSQFSSDIFNVPVKIRVAKVFPSNEQYGPAIKQIITRNYATHISEDWVRNDTLQIVLNGDNGKGLDIFFMPKYPEFLGEFNVSTVFGLMSINSQINIDTVPESTFYISSKDTHSFHGTLVDHPGCSIAIDVNTAVQVSVRQLFQGTCCRRMELAEWIISERKKKKIEGIDDFLNLVKDNVKELDSSALLRIRF